MVRNDYLVFLIFLCSCIFAHECAKYVCDSKLPSDVCLQSKTKQDYIIFELNPCDAPQVCDIHSMESKAKCRNYYLHPIRFPGEFCRNDTECYSTQCDNNTNKCIGRRFEEACVNDVDCAEGLYCENTKKICVKTIKENQECNSDLKCAPYLVCHKNKCILKASLLNGEPTSTPSACSSFYIRNGKCDDGPKLQRSENDPKVGPIKCPNEGVCSYKFADNEILTEPCQCGHTESGELLCAPGAGDVALEDYAIFMNKQKSLNTECHISKGPFCRPAEMNRLGRYFHNAYVAYENFTRWVSYYNNSDCVKDVLYQEYWYSNQHVKKVEFVETPVYLLGITALMVICLDVLLVLLYFKKWSADAEIIDKKSK